MNQPTYTLQDAAKMLGIGLRQIFSMLRDRRILNRENVPYQRYITQGLLDVRKEHWYHPTTGTRYHARPVVTNKGLQWLEHKLLKEEKTCQ